jgi:transposase
LYSTKKKNEMLTSNIETRGFRAMRSKASFRKAQRWRRTVDEVAVELHDNRRKFCLYKNFGIKKGEQGLSMS